MDYYAFHIGDYVKSTARISILEDGCYRRLIDIYYDTETPIPADFAKVCKAIGAISKAEKVALAWVLETFFKLEPDGYHNKRCDDVVAEYHAKAEQNRINGSKGGRPKAVTPQGISDNEANQNSIKTELKPNDNPTITQTKGNQEPITNNQDSPISSLRSDMPPQSATRADDCESFSSDEQAANSQLPLPQQLTPTTGNASPVAFPQLAEKAPPAHKNTQEHTTAATDENTHRIAENRPLSASPKTNPKAQRKAAKATTLPDDFEPSDANKAYAAQHGIDLGHELEMFKAYHTSKGSTSLSWTASMTTWLGRAKNNPYAAKPNIGGYKSKFKSERPPLFEVCRPEGQREHGSFQL